MTKQTVPLYLGDYGDPTRRLIGSAIVDLDTMTAEATVLSESAQKAIFGSVNLAVSIHTDSSTQ